MFLRLLSRLRSDQNAHRVVIIAGSTFERLANHNALAVNRLSMHLPNLALILSTLLFTPCLLAEEPALFIITVDGKHGFIDETGNIAIQPQYSNAYSFRDGLAAVQINDQWGFINEDAKLVIEPQFKAASPFSDGFARVREKSFTDKWKYIDKTGKPISNVGYDCAQDFQNGIAKVGNATTASKLTSLVADVGIECDYFYIDAKGNTVKEPPRTHFCEDQQTRRIDSVPGKRSVWIRRHERDCGHQASVRLVQAISLSADWLEPAPRL